MLIAFLIRQFCVNSSNDISIFTKPTKFGMNCSIFVNSFAWQWNLLRCCWKFMDITIVGTLLNFVYFRLLNLVCVRINLLCPWFCKNNKKYYNMNILRKTPIWIPICKSYESTSLQTYTSTYKRSNNANVSILKPWIRKKGLQKRSELHVNLFTFLMRIWKEISHTIKRIAI